MSTATSLSLLDRWLYALELQSWPKLLIAAALGQAIGVAAQGQASVAGLVFGLLFTLCSLSFIVFLNAWGSEEVDRLERRLFPESSAPKTIPDEILAPRSVVLAGFGAGAFALGVAILAEVWMLRPGLAFGAIGALLVYLAYTLPPLRLHYRGGKEIFEMLGVAFALPWWNAYLQGGETAPAGLVLLPGFALLCLSSALASGLGDEESDRLGGKRTFATMFGGDAVRQGVEGLVLAAMLIFAALPWLAPRFATPWMMFPVVAVMIGEYRVLRALGEERDEHRYHGSSAYKHQLDRCIWRATLVLAAVVAIVGLVGGSQW